MSLELEVSEKARRSLYEQYDWYCAHANEALAERFLQAFRETANRLKTSPMIGAVRRFSRPSLEGIRAVPLDPPFRVHLVFYRLDSTTLRIEFFIHGARDLPRRLREMPAVYQAPHPALVAPPSDVARIAS